ncbi:hypothetical protein M899_1487 [Bacteriovorax sp. BSW11_IV]|uniref:hypothetical protein n=1 Tax=Bacteriovorax sp. BSW11_IV TaxID=1353529 RepID=UPI00038A256C|nr:hypothetical protein [Bacteriovorax sp. BSW11_IV]EQC48332.1 hypothetical protein M899_1487 [Bacteriovorax sp. BSW11_IV]
MKKLLIITALISLNTLGGSGGIAGGSSTGTKPSSKSWESIRKRADYKLANTWAFVGKISNVFNVCVDGDNLRTINKEPVYGFGPRKGGDKEPERIITGHEYYSYPIVYTSYREVCNGKDKNCKKIPYTIEQDLDRDITVSKFVRTVGSRDNRRDVYEEVFTKPYSIPYCENE